MPLNFKHINGNEQILDGSIGTDLIADGAITAPKLAIGAITSSSLTIDSNLDFNNFEALQFRVENLDFFPPTGNPGRLIWRTDLRDLYVDTDYTLNIISARYVPFQVHGVTSLTDMSVNSTVGMLPGDTILQGGVPFGDIEIVEIVDLSNLVVDSTVDVNIGDVISQDNASTTVISITDTTHLVVASTVGLVPDIAVLSTPYAVTTITSITDSTNLVVNDTTGFAGRATANVNFGIVTIIDGTNLEVDNSTAISVGDVIQQGITTTTVTAVIDLTHIAVVDTTGFAVGICDVLVLIDISAIPNGTTLVVSKTTGFGPGNPITQGAASTTIVSVVNGTTLIVGSTSGFIVNSAVDSTVVVDDTALVNAGMLLTQGLNSSLIVSVVNATHLAVANASPFVAGPASTGNWVAINDGGSVNSIRSDTNPQLQGNITLASGTNVDLAQVSQTITVNVPAAGVTGQLQFNDNVANEFGADANLFWDNVTKRLGIGNAAPTTTLDVTGTANVSGATTLGSTLDVTDATTLNDTLDVTNATTLNNTLDVTGATTLNNTLDVVGATTLQNTLDVTGATTLSNTLDVTGLATFLNEIQMSADQRIIFNTAADTFIKYSTNHGGMVLQAGPGSNANLNFEGGIAMWANTLADGSGTYSPAFVMNNVDGVNISTATGGVLIDDDLTGSGPVASAKLEVKSTTRGFLTPRMTTVQRDAIVSPATGLQIYNTTTNQEEYYNGSIWAPIGNTAVAGINGEVQFNDNGVFGTNPNFFWDDINTRLGLGNSAPTTTLDVTGNVHTSSDVTVDTQINTDLIVSRTGDLTVQPLIDSGTGFNIKAAGAARDVIVVDTTNSVFQLHPRGDGYAEAQIRGGGTYLNFANTAGSTYYTQLANNPGVDFRLTTIDPAMSIKLIQDRDGNAWTWTFDTTGTLINPGDVSIPTDKKLYFDNTNVYFKRDSVFGDILVGNTAGGDSGFELATASANSAMTLYSNAGGSLGGNWAQIDLMPGVNPNVRLAPGGTGFVDVTTHLISNVVDPVSAQDAATKNYVDGPAHTVAGADTQIQYNNAGVFGADPKFRWDATNNTILVGTAPVVTNYYGLSIDDGSISLKDGTDTAGGIGLDMYNSSDTYLGGLYFYSVDGSVDLLTATTNAKISLIPGNNNTAKRMAVTENSVEIGTAPVINNVYGISMHADAMAIKTTATFAELDFYASNEDFIGLVAGESATGDIIVEADINNVWLRPTVAGKSVVAQSTGGASAGDASAILVANSTTQGFLPPRMTTVQRDAIASPAAGLIIYNTDTNLLQAYDGVAWVTIGQALFQQDIFNITGPGNVFNLSFTPINNSQVVYYNGLALAPGVTEDYTISGNVVTLDAGIVLANGDKILVVYSHY